MSGHQDSDEHPLPVMGCQAHTACTTWSARMLADDDRSLEELVEVVERAATTLRMRETTHTLFGDSSNPDDIGHPHHVDMDARRIARLALAGCAIKTSAVGSIAQLQQMVRGHQDPATATSTDNQDRSHELPQPPDWP